MASSSRFLLSVVYIVFFNFHEKTTGESFVYHALFPNYAADHTASPIGSLCTKLSFTYPRPSAAEAATACAECVEADGITQCLHGHFCYSLSDPATNVCRLDLFTFSRAGCAACYGGEGQRGRCPCCSSVSDPDAKTCVTFDGNYGGVDVNEDDIRFCVSGSTDCAQVWANNTRSMTPSTSDSSQLFSSSDSNSLDSSSIVTSHTSQSTFHNNDSTVAIVTTSRKTYSSTSVLLYSTSVLLYSEATPSIPRDNENKVTVSSSDFSVSVSDSLPTITTLFATSTVTSSLLTAVQTSSAYLNPLVAIFNSSHLFRTSNAITSYTTNVPIATSLRFTNQVSSLTTSFLTMNSDSSLSKTFSLVTPSQFTSLVTTSNSDSSDVFLTANYPTTHKTESNFSVSSFFNSGLTNVFKPTSGFFSSYNFPPVTDFESISYTNNYSFSLVDSVSSSADKLIFKNSSHFLDLSIISSSSNLHNSLSTTSENKLSENSMYFTDFQGSISLVTASDHRLSNNLTLFSEFDITSQFTISDSRFSQNLTNLKDFDIITQPTPTSRNELSENFTYFSEFQISSFLTTSRNQLSENLTQLTNFKTISLTSTLDLTSYPSLSTSFSDFRSSTEPLISFSPKTSIFMDLPMTTETPAAPTAQPESPCPSRQNPLNLFIVVDVIFESGDAFNATLNFLVGILSSLEDDDRLAVLVNNRSNISVSFEDSATKSRVELMEEIVKIEHDADDDGGRTTGRAISKAVEHFETKGSRDRNATNAIVLSNDRQNGEDLVATVNEANERGIFVYLVAIGDHATTVWNDESRFIKVTDIYSLASIKNVLLAKICKDRVDITIDCIHDKDGYPLMRIVIPKLLEVNRTVSVGSCSNPRQNDGFSNWFLDIPTNECGTATIFSGESIVYENLLILDETSMAPKNTDRSLWRLRCNYGDVSVGTISFAVPSANVPILSEDADFRVEMQIFRSNAFVDRISPPFVIRLMEPIWLQIVVPAKDVEISVRNLWLTTGNESSEYERYLLQDGCVIDEILSNNYSIGEGNEKRFSFLGFQLRPKSENVFLHCEVLICDPRDSLSRCKEGCVSEKRRRRRRDDETNVIAVKQSFISLIVLGPEQPSWCDPIENVTFGRLDCTDDFKPGSSCTILCDQGFYLHSRVPGERFVACVQSDNSTRSSWNAHAPECRDVDECSIGVDLCLDPLEICRNVPGFFECDCRLGLERSTTNSNKCSVGLSLTGSVSFTNEFSAELKDSDSPVYRENEREVKDSLTSSFRNAKVTVNAFERGSVVALFDAFLFRDNNDDNNDIEKLKLEVKQNLLLFNFSTLNLNRDSDFFQLRDKDECDDSWTNDCANDAICVNTIGSFSCRCQDDFADESDSRFPGRKCTQIPITSGDYFDLVWLAAPLVVLFFLLCMICLFFVKTKLAGKKRINPEEGNKREGNSGDNYVLMPNEGEAE